MGGAGGGEASLRAWVGLVWSGLVWSGLVWLSLAQLAGGRRGDGASVRWVGWNSSLLIEEGMNYQRGTLSYIIRAGNSYTLPYIYVYELVYVVCILASYYKLVVMLLHTLARVYYVYYERVGVLWEYGVYAYTPPSLNHGRFAER